jgi:replicative DNA helicase
MKNIPVAEEVEKAILGEILRGSEFGFEGIENLRKEHFFIRNNQVIFQCISAMSLNNEPVDLVTVSNKLKSIGSLDSVGGAGYISSLLSQSGRFSPSQYIPILEEKFKLRKFIEHVEKSIGSAYDQTESNSIFSELEKVLFDLQADANAGNLTSKVCSQVLKDLEKKQRGEVEQGLRTSIHPWDNMMGGLRKLFYVLAARAAKGKTAMAEQMISQIIRDGNAVAVFEKDMSLEMLIARLACREANVPFVKYDLGKCNFSEYEEIKRWIKFFDTPLLRLFSPKNLTPSSFYSIVKREKKLNNIKAVFLDHVLHLDVGSDFRVGLTLASKVIRDSVRDNDIAHVILAQLNREAHNNERPTPKHIKEFDALYADCDTMVMLWSEKDSADVPSNELFPIKFTANKVRGGSEFEDDLGFNRPIMKFVPLKKI